MILKMIQDLVLHLYEDRKNGVHLTTCPELLAALHINPLSTGFIVWILITFAYMPSAFSIRVIFFSHG